MVEKVTLGFMTTKSCTSRRRLASRLILMLTLGLFSLAVRYALETTPLGELSPQFIRDGPANPQNPYILPFAMRGLLEEDYVRTELHDETTELLRQFDDWRPLNKPLKDVKYRLEGVRSKI